MELIDAIMERHTVWHYEPRSVERPKLLDILEAARWAPSGGNTQPWDFIIVTEPALKKEMRKLVKLAHRRWMTEAAIVPQPEEEIEKVCLGIDKYTPPEVCYINFCMTFKEYYVPERQPKPEYIRSMNYQSIGAAVQNLLLAATNNGLGTHWVGCTSLVQPEIVDLFGIPDNTEVVGTIVVGYPSKDSSVRGGVPVVRTRNPVDAFVHFDRW